MQPCSRSLTSLLPALAANVVRVVAEADQSEPPVVVVDQSVGAASEEALALVALVVQVALRLVAHSLGPRLAGVLAHQAGEAVAIGRGVGTPVLAVVLLALGEGGDAGAGRLRSGGELGRGRPR